MPTSAITGWTAISFSLPGKEAKARSIATKPGDDHVIRQKGVLFAVIDGAPSASCHDKAAEVAGQALIKSYYSSEAGTQPIEALRYAVQHAVMALDAIKEPRCGGLAIALCAAVVQGESLFISRVGDANAYLASNDKLVLLTDDPCDFNAISESSATLQPGDRILLCTEGVSQVVSAEEMERALCDFSSAVRSAESVRSTFVRTLKSDHGALAVFGFQVPQAERATAAAVSVPTLDAIPAPSRESQATLARAPKAEPVSAAATATPEPATAQAPEIPASRVVEPEPVMAQAREIPASRMVEPEPAMAQAQPAPAHEEPRMRAATPELAAFAQAEPAAPAAETAATQEEVAPSIRETMDRLAAISKPAAKSGAAWPPPAPPRAASNSGPAPRTGQTSMAPEMPFVPEPDDAMALAVPERLSTGESGPTWPSAAFHQPVSDNSSTARMGQGYREETFKVKRGQGGTAEHVIVVRSENAVVKLTPVQEAAKVTEKARASLPSEKRMSVGKGKVQTNDDKPIIIPASRTPRAFSISQVPLASKPLANADPFFLRLAGTVGFMAVPVALCALLAATGVFGIVTDRALVAAGLKVAALPPTLTATPTVEPTTTATMTVTPKPTLPPEPTATAAPTEAPTLTPIPPKVTAAAVAFEPTNVPTLAPTATPEPTLTPEPTKAVAVRRVVRRRTVVRATPRPVRRVVPARPSNPGSGGFGPLPPPPP